MPSILEAEATNAPRLRPLNDYVYVRQDKLPEKVGNFWLPDSARKGRQVRFGTVLAVGPGRLVCLEITEPIEAAKLFDEAEAEMASGWISSAVVNHSNGRDWITKRMPPRVKPGDRVCFMDYAGEALISETDPSLLVMKESELLGKLIE